MRILFLIDELYAGAGGGTEKHFLQLTRHCRDHGITPTIVFLRQNSAHTAIEWMEEPTTLDLPSIVSLSLPGALRKLQGIVSHRQIDCIHAFFDTATILSSLLGHLNPALPAVCSQRNVGHHRRNLDHLLYRIIYRRFDRLLVNSQAVWDYVELKYPEAANRLMLIENICDPGPRTAYQGAEFRKAFEIAPRATLGVVLSNLRPIKGISDLIDAVESFRAELRDVCIVVAGDGADRASFESELAARGLEGMIKLAGYVENVTELLSAADFFVHPSRAEGSSNALIEAMAAGLPVVATDVGSARSLIDDTQSGLVVEPKAPDQLGRAIVDIVNELSVWRTRSERSAERIVHRFSASRILAGYRSAYGDAIARRHRLRGRR